MADILTKPLCETRFDELKMDFGMINVEWVYLLVTSTEKFPQKPIEDTKEAYVATQEPLV